MTLDPTWIALIGTVFGGVGLKAIEHWLGKNRVKVDDASKIRDELRADLLAQKEEVRALEAEVNKWRDEYYDLRDKYVQLQTELTLALQKIKDEAAEAATRAETLQSEPPATPSPIDATGANKV